MVAMIAEKITPVKIVASNILFRRLRSHVANFGRWQLFGFENISEIILGKSIS